MSNLNDLVPPLELCKKIPAGEFQDSAFVWVVNGDYQPKFQIVDKRKYPFIPEDGATLYPAPTLQEIMEALPHDDAYNDLLIGYSAKVDKLTGWHIYYNGDRKRHCYDQRAVTAALKLFLKLSDPSDK